ncbi:uncharacterized protein Cp110 isoform X2 [Prorops nasuta]
MENITYTSCIKINGVPILPPMMTEDIAEEMRYYKKLALAVEERIKAAKHIVEGCQEINSDMDDSALTDSESINLETIAHVSPIDSLLLKDSQNCQIQSKNELKEFNENLSNTGCLQANTIEKNLENEMVFLDNDISGSDSLNASTDLNCYMSENSLSKSNTTEPTLEMWKPQVPKTLDIIPLTLSSSISNKDNSSTLGTVKDEEIKPKLVRQGSYVLDSPSSMLLAHMQTELKAEAYIPNEEYVPTSTTAIKRKEWNIAQAKTDWENQSKNLNYINSDLSKSASNIKYRRRSTSISISQKTWKTAASDMTESPFSKNNATRSLDCIQAMLAKEYINKTSGRYNSPHNKYNTNGHICDHQKLPVEKSVSLVPMINKVSTSLEDINTEVYKSQPIKETFEEKLSKTSADDYNKKQTTGITSEKIFAIFKQIQNMHKKQMHELVSKQQNERILLQKEFEKQQMILLAQVKKTCPDLSIFSSQNKDSFLRGNSMGCLNILDCSSNKQKISNNAIVINNNDSKKSSIIHHSDQDNLTVTSNLSTDCIADNGIALQLYTQQSFPLDSKTTYIPVFTNPVYTEKHIHAAIIINAYARGYLVRRLMKTGRVIALKNTYKEALQCMLKLLVDSPLNLSELNFHKRLQLQCDAASMTIVELFSQSPRKRMQVIAHDRELKQSRAERPTSARSYSFATQRTLARKKLKEMGESYEFYPLMTRSYPSARSRCQTWTSDARERLISPNKIYQGIKRSTSAGAVRKPWR